MTKLDIALRFNNDGVVSIAPLGFELYQNTPNPWTDKTQIRFYLPDAGEARLTVFDEQGTVCFAKNNWYDKGYHRIVLDGNQITAPGMYFYRLETATEHAVRKMAKF